MANQKLEQLGELKRLLEPESGKKRIGIKDRLHGANLSRKDVLRSRKVEQEVLDMLDEPAAL